MFVYKSTWQGQETFKLLPHGKDCVFNEIIYDPIKKMLVVVSKEKLEKPQVIPAIDKYGDNITSTHRGDLKLQVERRTLSSFYEYYITDKDDILELLAFHVHSEEQRAKYLKFF